jgi:adenosylcobinamide-GDP ribazoletransferase
VVTGALHEDGLADVADATGAHASRERRLEILRDPRVGAFGALAVAFMVLFPVVLLAPLDGEDFMRAAVVGHVLGRWSTLPHALLLPPARPDGSGSLLRASPARAAMATAFAVAVALLAGRPAAGAVTLGVAAVMTLATGLHFRRTFGGVSGDTFGAATKLVELSSYAALVAMWA